MDEEQIYRLLHSLDCFQGVFASNELPKHITRWPAAYIVNTDPRSKPGSHWVAIFAPQRSKIEYFDPYGIPPFVNSIIKFIRRNSKRWYFNDLQFQPSAPLSTACGLYCILFVRIRCGRIGFNDFVKLFAKNNTVNDVLAELYMKLTDTMNAI